MAKDKQDRGFLKGTRFKKRVPVIKLPFGLGDVKVNLSMSHGIESITAQGKLGKLQSNINYNLHKNTVQGLTSVAGTGLSKQYTLQTKEQSDSQPKEESKDGSV
tara:strand:+ start:265 stop:576 length:312 start_codon:yes stop_codon:yes gene_type:complete